MKHGTFSLTLRLQTRNYQLLRVKSLPSILLNIMYILQETSERLRAYRSFSPCWKVKLNAKDEWLLKTLIIKKIQS